ncbi:MAG: hypothetical protein EOP67_66600 [Sphingomonas sp.]|nr:MAG: hypothetical protein EOP67_66600 [Sphingomonas sp.]
MIIPFEKAVDRARQGSADRSRQRRNRGKMIKKCPNCVEQVQSEARVCRFCGYDFRRRRNPNMTTGDVAGCAVSGCALWIFGPIILLLLLAFIGSTMK